MNKENLIVVDHPLIKNKLAILRNKDTKTHTFRKVLYEISCLEAYEATRHLQTQTKTIQTPLQETECEVFDEESYVIVPILRAGLGFVDGLLQVLPQAKIGHIGLYRDEETREPVVYYDKMPPNLDQKEILLVDPMLATGGSASYAIKYLREHGVTKTITFMVLVATPEGIETIQKADENTRIVTCAVDDGLNENAYIIPGLGDAGDRIFGTP